MIADRQTGRTTRQMLAAPKNSFYVWANESLSYPRSLAMKLDRNDLQIKPLSWLRLDNVRGRRILTVTIDHAAPWNDETVAVMEYALSKDEFIFLW